MVPTAPLEIFPQEALSGSTVLSEGHCHPPSLTPRIPGVSLAPLGLASLWGQLIQSGVSSIYVPVGFGDPVEA